MKDLGTSTGVGALAPARHRNRVLGRQGWTVLRDLHRPGDAAGRIDRLFVGPGGVVVVESARWPGEVTVTDAVLRHLGEVRSDATEHAAQTAAAVASILPPPLRTAVRGVVSLAYQDLAATPAGVADVIGEAGLEDWLLSLPVRLTPAQSDVASVRLLHTLTGRTPDVSTSAELDAPRRRNVQRPAIARQEPRDVEEVDLLEELHLRMTSISLPAQDHDAPITVVTPVTRRSDAWSAPRRRRARSAPNLWPFVWFGSAVLAFLNIETLAALLG